MKECCVLFAEVGSLLKGPCIYSCPVGLDTVTIIATSTNRTSSYMKLSLALYVSTTGIYM